MLSADVHSLLRRSDLTESDLGSDLKVVFADLQSETPTEKIFTPSLTDWQRQTFDAAVDCTRLLNREMIDILQRNLNANFSLLRKLTDAKNPGEIVQLQAAHLSNQMAALAGQGEELVTLSVKAATAFLRQTYPDGWQLLRH